MVASRSIRPLRTMAGPAVTTSSTHCRLGRAVHRLLVRRRGDAKALDPLASWARWIRWPLGVVELQGTGIGLEDRGGDPGQSASFELDVVLHADLSQGGDFATTQTRHPPASDVGQAGLLGSDLGPT